MAIEIETFEEVKTDTDFESMLGEYKDAKIEAPQPNQETSESIVQNLGEPEKVVETPPDPTKWHGDNRYYQTGKKAGELRPKPKITASYNHNATTSIPATMLVNGAMFLMVINIIFPLVIVAVNNWLSPKEKMTVKDLKLTKEEVKEIDPLMDATLKQLNINGNPFILLCITLVASYAGKFMAIKLGDDKEEKETKTEKK